MLRAILSILVLTTAGPALAQSGATHQNAPGTLYHDEANRAYEDGFYREALQKFRTSARWADKLSQYNLGVMYYKGQGTAKDPAQAWAWFALAAERGYPQMVEAADALWADLDDAQRERARELHQELLPEYGDAVAVERTARYMERERKGLTGSRVGFVGALTVHTRDGFSEDGEAYYSEERWDYRRLIELESRLFEELARGRVEVGEIEVIEEKK